MLNRLRWQAEIERILCQMGACNRVPLRVGRKHFELRLHCLFITGAVVSVVGIQAVEQVQFLGLLGKLRVEAAG